MTCKNYKEKLKALEWKDIESAPEGMLIMGYYKVNDWVKSMGTIMLRKYVPSAQTL